MSRRRPLLPWRRDPRSDIEEELVFHLEARVHDLVREGVPEAEARVRAEEEFGSVNRIRCELEDLSRRRRRRERWAALGADAVADVRLGLRALARNRGYAAALLGTLVLVIGATTAVFALVRGILLAPLPYPTSERLVVAWEHNLPRSRPENVVSVPMYEAWAEGVQALAGAAALVPDGNTLNEGDARRVDGAAVTASWFEVVGVPPALGRGFTDEEARAGDMVVLSHGLWRDVFGAEPGIVGRSIRLSGRPHTVVGVMPVGFQPPAFGWLGEDQRYWVPFAPDEGNRSWGRFLLVLGRLAPGATADQADAQVKAVVRNREAEDPQLAEWTADVVPLHEQVTGEVRMPLLVLLVGVTCLLLVGVVNVTTLVLSRAQRREAEFAVRAAIGAGRRRLTRQLAGEAAAVALLAAPLGLLLGWAALRWIAAMLPTDVPRTAGLGVDAAVVGVSFLATVAATVAAGLAPSLRLSMARARDGLRTAGRRVVGGTGGRALVVAEISLALVLATGAGLAMRSYVALRHVPLGFDARETTAFRVDLPDDRYPTDAAVLDFWQRLLERLRAAPGVEAVAAVSVRPLRSGGSATTVAAFQGQGTDARPVADIRIATPDYFRAAGIPRPGGAPFEPDEDFTVPGNRQAVVNATLAATLWPGEDPTGRSLTVRLGGDTVWTVAGVVEDVRLAGPATAPRATVYLPHATGALGGMDVLVRSGLPEASRLALARQALSEVDGSVPLYDVETLEGTVATATARQGVEFALLGGFSLVALLLAATGIHGVLAMEVGGRRREMAVRLALGAAPGRLQREVLVGAAGVTALGLVLGVAGALGLTRFMASLLYGVEPTDPVTFAGVVALLTTVALVAAWIPARRAAAVDPQESMRAE